MRLPVRWSVATLLAGFAWSALPAGAAPSAADGGLAPNVFAAALMQGKAAAPVAESSPQITKVLHALQARSGSAEPVSILAERILSFEQQPNCGRVRFALGQPSAKIVFAAFGGQMNVCKDGRPPLRTCPEGSGRLVPAEALCANGKPPVDTEEVGAAIRAATTAGGLTQDQMLKQWAHHLAERARAASAAGGAASAIHRAAREGK